MGKERGGRKKMWAESGYLLISSMDASRGICSATPA